MRFAAVSLLTLLAACGAASSKTAEHNAFARIDEFVALQPSTADDHRVSSLISFARAADGMMTSAQPVEVYAEDLMVRQNCFSMTYGLRIHQRQEEMLVALADTPERQQRWQEYVALSSSMATPFPDEDTCDA